MSVVTESLTAKVGPLPAWAWGLGLGGTIVGIRWYRNRSTPVPTEAAGTSASEGGAGGEPGGLPTIDGPEGATMSGGVVGSYSIPSTYQANPGGVITADGTASGSPDDGPLNNAEWRERAFDALRAKGYGTVPASTALSKYLSSAPLTAADEAMIAYVLQMVGEPPEGAPAIVREGNPPPVTAPGQVPAATPIPTPAQPWVKPAWLNGIKFVKGSGPAVYLVTDAGLEWLPSEAAFYAQGGGGTITDVGGGKPYTYGGNPTGTPPVVIPDSMLASLPKVGTQPS